VKEKRAKQWDIACHVRIFVYFCRKYCRGFSENAGRCAELRMRPMLPDGPVCCGGNILENRMTCRVGLVRMAFRIRHAYINIYT
jgi:hypothetical protein